LNLSTTNGFEENKFKNNLKKLKNLELSGFRGKPSAFLTNSRTILKSAASSSDKK